MNYTSARLGLVCALLFLCSAVVFGWDDQSSSSILHHLLHPLRLLLRARLGRILVQQQRQVP